MPFKKIIVMSVISFCCGVQHASETALTKRKLPLPSSDSSIMSPRNDSVASSGYLASCSVMSFERKAENSELEALRNENELLKKQKETLENRLTYAGRYRVELERELLDLEKKMRQKTDCNTILSAFAAFVVSTCTTVFCLSPSCENKQ